MSRRLRDFLVLGLSTFSLTLAACGDDSVASQFGSGDGTETDAIPNDSASGTSSTSGATATSMDSASGESMSTSTTTDSAGTESDSDSAGTDSGTDSAGTDSAGTDSAGTDSAGTDSAGTDSAGSTGGDTDGMACDFHSDCDDGLYCTGAELCVAGFCEAGDPPVCDDGVACTVDACDEASQGCIAAASDAICDDGSFCNGAETCDAINGCQPGTDIVCDDTVACTIDACNETTDQCDFTVDDTNCDNGVFCDGAETCDGALGCQSAPDVDCNDLIACTTDSCNEGTDQCDNIPDDAVCDNGEFCDGDEVCDAQNGCMPGTTVDCPQDAHACTIEACNETSDQCETTLDSGLCPNGQFCTTGGCAAGTPCNDDSDCDDGLACNGDENCDLSQGVPGTCQPGVSVNCFDGVGCTADSCVEPANPNDPPTCSNVPNDAACVDADLCNGDETCDALADCQPGTALDCDDGISCTNDSCFAQFGCFNPADNTSCQDGSVCNGEEICDPQLGGCQPSPGPLVCPSDGVACTNDICDEGFGGCRFVPDDSNCACGETCDLSLGCNDVCNVATCGGKVYECGDCIDNDADCGIDDRDTDCFGVCDNNESGFKGEIPGQNSAPCKMDCYFDGDSGSGNDDCYWSHECDPFEPSLLNNGCEYDENANVPGTGASCAELLVTQDPVCDTICGPVVPNGCDCFGCCEVTTQTGTRTVFLGTEDAGGDGTCNIDVIDDVNLCRECTQVDACLNPCGTCEICFGQTELPPECTVQECDEAQPCGQPGQAPCQPGEFCLTGCCSLF